MHSRRSKSIAFEFEFTGFDFREIENVIEQPQQRVGGLLQHFAGTRAAAPISSVFEQQLGHADDAVHGSANLVAHVGEKFALGAIGPFGRIFGNFQFCFGAF